MQEVVDFLKKTKSYYLATAEGDQPRVRPFGTAHAYNGRLYIQTGKVKPCSKQMGANPKVEICAFDGEVWVRIEALAINDDSFDAKQSLLDAYPQLKGRYSADDDNMQVLYLKDATATFNSFGDRGEPKVIKF